MLLYACLSGGGAVLLDEWRSCRQRSSGPQRDEADARLTTGAAVTATLRRVPFARTAAVMNRALVRIMVLEQTARVANGGRERAVKLCSGGGRLRLRLLTADRFQLTAAAFPSLVDDLGRHIHTHPKAKRPHQHVHTDGYNDEVSKNREAHEQIRRNKERTADERCARGTRLTPLRFRAAAVQAGATLVATARIGCFCRKQPRHQPATSTEQRHHPRSPRVPVLHAPARHSLVLHGRALGTHLAARTGAHKGSPDARHSDGQGVGRDHCGRVRKTQQHESDRIS